MHWWRLSVAWPCSWGLPSKEIDGALGTPQPTLPDRESVEAYVIGNRLDDLQQELETGHRQQHGERPTSGWFVGTRQKQWDKEHAQIDRQVEQRKEHLRSDAPEARQFRAQAQQQYGAEHTAWEKARGY